ncbi:creatinine amidohydrolase [Singulisphaera sp. GP187]|uniref:creatininase family protein n=1 Tax=Singulisphaera sp. GP187 TaxID=1882752 RepID=UPI0009284029|nr:creatininase family protein [Singulisphaera sp. GP187]SIO58745.1 creatinine amidohydrolase [Singulisphaera sp. GP187]
MRFAEMTAPELRALSRERTLIIAPIAACEQHSRHLPVFTDSILVAAVADAVERSLPEQVLLLPVLWMGASEHHLPFGGTLTATLPTYELMLMELLTPLLRDGFRRTMLLNGHGGNIDPLRIALRRLDTQFPQAVLTGAAYWELAEAEIAALCQGPRKTMGHACEIETSMIMHLRPDLVRKDLILDDPDPDTGALRSITWARDFGRRTDHGAVGYPEAADADRGRKMLEAIGHKVRAVAEGVLNLPLS